MATQLIFSIFVASQDQMSTDSESEDDSTPKTKSTQMSSSSKPQSALSKYAGLSSSSSSEESDSDDNKESAETETETESHSKSKKESEKSKYNSLSEQSRSSSSKPKAALEKHYDSPSSEESERTSEKPKSQRQKPVRPNSAKPKHESNTYKKSSSSSSSSARESDTESEQESSKESKAREIPKSEMKKFIAVSSSDESDVTNSEPEEKIKIRKKSSDSSKSTASSNTESDDDHELEIPSHMKPFTNSNMYGTENSLGDFGTPILAHDSKENKSSNNEGSLKLKQKSALSLSNTHIPLLSLQTNSSLDLDSKRDASIGQFSKVIGASSSNFSAESHLEKSASLDIGKIPNSARGKTGAVRSIRSINQSASFPDLVDDQNTFKWNDTSEFDLKDLENMIPAQKIKEILKAHPEFDIKSILWKPVDSKEGSKEILGAYYGTLASGKRHGWGIYQWSDGREYRGEWADDFMDGIGVYTWPQQPPKSFGLIKEAPGPISMNNVRSLYKGYFRRGQMEGIGHLTDEKGSTYKGGWRGGQISGEGVIQGKDRSEYRGSLLNNKPHGKGTMKFSDKSTYDGMWEDGRKEGSGNYIWNDGEVEYIGNFKKGNPDGRGTATWRMNSGKEKLLNQYNGEWKAGLRHGEGKYMWCDATLYSGEWVRGKMKPRGGELLFPDGTRK